jgi:hypothetical protein
MTFLNEFSTLEEAQKFYLEQRRNHFCLLIRPSGACYLYAVTVFDPS